MSDLGASIRDAIEEAIQIVLREQEKGFVTKWVAVVESVGPEGRRGLWTMAANEAKTWDVLGMLEYGVSLEQAQILRGATEVEE